MKKFSLILVLLALIMLSTAADVDAYNVYYGQLHSHTRDSDGSGTPEEAYQYARDIAELDFFSIADHCSYPYGGQDGLTEKEYDNQKSVADIYNEDGVYTTFWGFEWTSDDTSWGGPDTLLGKGHITIINSPDHCEADEVPTNVYDGPGGLVDWMSTRDCVAFFNHPGEYDYTFDDFLFTYTDKIVGMELWNRNDDFYNYFDTPGDWYHKAIDNGLYIGAAGSGDNHSANWGTQNEWRMAILAPELTRTSLLAAMKARRFYSCRDKNLVLSFTCNDAQMGSLIAGGDLDVVIDASDGDEEFFSKIELLKNGAIIGTWLPDSPTPSVTTTVTGEAGDYFYVIAYQGGGSEAISSPIFIIDILDGTPPEPDPMTWEAVPAATSDASIAMEASVATDDFYSVLYYFTCTAGGGNDSGWQAETFYEDTGLTRGTTYTYTVTARDTSTDKNETAASDPEFATTEVDDSPPQPSPMTWADVPYATGDSSIAMTATEATDEYGVQYNFICTAGGGNDSGWQDDTFYEDTGLMHETEYAYTVTARDTSTAKNETAPSTSESATTDPEDTVTPTPDPMTWNSAPDGTSTSTISMTATTASDTSGVEYYFECTEGSGHDSGWQDSPTYEDTGLMYGTQYTYIVKARDKCADHNVTAPSDPPASATTLTGPALWTSKAVYAPGEDIVVNFANAAGNSEDWIGLYVDGTSDESYLTWKYLGDPSGSITFVNTLLGEGAYEARLFFRGSYKLEAFFDFTVADTTPPTLEAPSVLSATAISTTQIDLSWTDNASDETGFKIERSERVNDSFALIATVDADVIFYNDTGLRKGTTYHYRVRATNASGDSAYSNEISAMTLRR